MSMHMKIVALAMMAVGCATEAPPTEPTKSIAETAYSTDCAEVWMQYTSTGNCHSSFQTGRAFGGEVYTCCGGTGDGTSTFLFCSDGLNGVGYCQSTYDPSDNVGACAGDGGGDEGGGGGGGGCSGIGDECASAGTCCSNLACDASNHCVDPGN